MPDQLQDQRLRAAIEVEPDALIVVDHQGRIVTATPGVEDLFGYVPQELLGSPFAILISEADRGTSQFPPPQPSALTKRDLLARSKDGRTVPVEIAWNSFQTPLGTWVLASISDIDARVRAAQRFRLILEAPPNAMVLSDRDGTIVFVNANAERLFGFEAAALLGQPVEILLPEDLRITHTSLRAGFASAPSRRQMGVGRNTHARRKDGTCFPVEIGIIPIPTSEGVWVLSSILDITFHRQRLESIGVLAGGVAHDFNNLLGSILADAELALSELSDGSSPVAEIHNIRTVAVRASEIVRQLMIYAGQEQTHRERIDLSLLVQEMLQLLRVSIPKHALLRTDLPRNLPPLMVNAPQIRQVAMNLILNASEAIGEKGIISVGTSFVRAERRLPLASGTELPPGDYLKLEVADTGCGMTQEEKARAFDPFFTTKFAGRGLGLAVVQGIVGAHSGRIHVESLPGRGTTFDVFFPCAAENVGMESTASRVTPEPAPSGRPRTVLIVEDEDALRLPVAKMLRRHGFSIKEASNGSTAIEIVTADPRAIDVILLDFTIPGASGAEVLEAVHRIRPDIQVVLTSAYGMDMLSLPPGAAQISGFIRKPFQLSELRQLLEDVLSPKTARPAGA